MPYAKFDDRFPGHKKIRVLSDAAYRVHTQAIIWAAKELSDGRLLRRDLADIARPVKRVTQAVRELEDIGLWEPAGDDGWLIHDYLDWQISAARWRAEQEANRKRQQAHRDKAAERVTALRNGAHNAVSNGPPDQTRPDQTEGLKAVTPLQDPTVPIPEPPLTCPTHEDDPDPPPCGPCKAARIAHGKWEQAESDRKRAMPKCRRHPGQPAHNCALCRSEKLGAE